MRYILPDLSNQEHLNDLYAKVYPSNSFHLRLRPSVSHAMTEVMKGLFRLYPHKQEAIVLSGQSPYTFKIEETLARDGVKVTSLDQASEVADMISSETLFCLLCEDNPVSGKIFDLSKAIEVCLNKKIFIIVLRHNNFLLQPEKYAASPYLIEIRNHQDYAALLLGARAKKIDSLLYSNISFHCDVKATSIDEDKKLVKDFESRAVTTGWKPYFTEKDERLWDRGVISLQENAAAFASVVSEELPAARILATSQCVLKHPFTFSWWKDEVFNEKSQNEWLIMDLETMKNLIPLWDKILTKYRNFTKF